MRHTGLPALLAVIAASCTVSEPAHAFERQWHAGVDAGYAWHLRGDVLHGYGGGGHLSYGLSDAFNAMLELAVSRHVGASDIELASGKTRTVDRDATMWSAGAGIAYTLDVARVVPYAGILLGAYKATGTEAMSLAPGAQLAIGLDYQLERNWAIGAQFRLHTIVSNGTFTYGTTFLRAEYVWGF